MTALNDARPIIRKADPADLSMELNGPIRYLYGNREAAEKAFKGESVVYISLSGIKEYLDSDMFQETGSGTNKGDRDGLKEKIRILKEAKKKLGSTVYLIDERNIPPARTWFVALSGKEKLILCRRDNAHIFIVTESGIVDAFNSFMEELPNSGNLLRTDLAMEQIDRLLAEAE